MAEGICYTWSGDKKKYEGIRSGDVPDKVTVYTVGYPSTAYYPDGGEISFSIIPYPPPPGYPEVEGFTEGMAHYTTNMYLNNIDSNSTYKKIYDLMSDTPPDGYVLDKNGDYLVTRFTTVYSYNYGIKYYDKTNIINGATQTIKKDFRYKKIKDLPDYYLINVNYERNINDPIDASNVSIIWNVKSYKDGKILQSYIPGGIIDDLNFSIEFDFSVINYSYRENEIVSESSTEEGKFSADINVSYHLTKLYDFTNDIDYEGNGYDYEVNFTQFTYPNKSHSGIEIKWK